MALSCISFWGIGRFYTAFTYGMIYDRRYPMRPTAAKGFYLYFYPADATITQQHSLWDTLLANSTDELVIDLTKTVSGPIAPLAGR